MSNGRHVGRALDVHLHVWLHTPSVGQADPAPTPKNTDQDVVLFSMLMPVGSALGVPVSPFVRVGRIVILSSGIMLCHPRGFTKATGCAPRAPRVSTVIACACRRLARRLYYAAESGAGGTLCSVLTSCFIVMGTDCPRTSGLPPEETAAEGFLIALSPCRESPY